MGRSICIYVKEYLCPFCQILSISLRLYNILVRYRGTQKTKYMWWDKPWEKVLETNIKRPHNKLKWSPGDDSVGASSSPTQLKSIFWHCVSTQDFLLQHYPRET